MDLAGAKSRKAARQLSSLEEQPEGLQVQWGIEALAPAAQAAHMVELVEEEVREAKHAAANAAWEVPAGATQAEKDRREHLQVGMSMYLAAQELDRVEREVRSEYNWGFKSWTLGRHPIGNYQEVTPWGWQNLQVISTQIQNFALAEVLVAQDIRTFLTKLYVAGPSNEHEIELYYKYLVYPVIHTFNKLNKELKKHGLTRMVQPEDMRKQHGKWRVAWGQFILAGDMSSGDPTPLNLHPAVNKYMRESWRFGVFTRSYVQGRQHQGIDNAAEAAENELVAEFGPYIDFNRFNPSAPGVVPAYASTGGGTAGRNEFDDEDLAYDVGIPGSADTGTISGRPVVAPGPAEVFDPVDIPPPDEEELTGPKDDGDLSESDMSSDEEGSEPLEHDLVPIQTMPESSYKAFLDNLIREQRTRRRVEAIRALSRGN